MRTGPKRGQGPAESRRNQCVFVRGFRLEVNEAYLASAVASPSLSGIRMDEASGTGALHEREASTPPSSLGAISNRTEEKQGSANEVMYLSVKLAITSTEVLCRSRITRLSSSTGTC